MIHHITWDFLYLLSSLQLQEVLDDGLAFRRQHAFGMKLDAMDIVVLVLQAHDATVIAHGGDIQALGEIASIYYPRMVSSYLDSLLHALEYRIDAKLGARGGNAMIHLLEVGELGTKRLAYRLMTQTYAQHRLDACILPDDIHQQPRLGWDSRTRTQYDLIKWLQLAELKLVVAIHRNVHAQLLHQMCQIIGEGIVIIYDYYFHVLIMFNI